MNPVLHSCYLLLKEVEGGKHQKSTAKKKSFFFFLTLFMSSVKKKVKQRFPFISIYTYMCVYLYMYTVTQITPLK